MKIFLSSIFALFSLFFIACESKENKSIESSAPIQQLTKENLINLLNLAPNEEKSFALNDGFKNIAYLHIKQDIDEIMTLHIRHGNENLLFKLPSEEINIAQNNDKLSVQYKLGDKIFNLNLGDEVRFMRAFTQKTNPNYINSIQKPLFPKGLMTDEELFSALKEKVENDFNDYVRLNDKMPSTSAFEEYSKLDYLDSNIIVFNKFSYQFGGGAHGNYANTAQIYHLNGEEISNKLEDLFDLNAHKTQLLAIFDKALRAQEEQLFADSFPLKIMPNSFFVRENGIRFLWGLYDIAPYVAGEIEITIYFKDLAAFIKEDSELAYLFK